MSFSDPIGDMLTRIRNAQRVMKPSVRCPHSKMREGVLAVLLEEGYIRGYKQETIRQGVSEIIIELKYHEQRPVVEKIVRVSKPGLRKYQSVSDLPKVMSGMGISILSTSRGILSDSQARALNVGGEVICHVF